jgi:hypothetical protein
MSTNYRKMGLLALAIGGMTLVELAPARGAEPELPRDGWVSWQVPAVDDAPAWCCFSSWNDRDSSRMVCRLDGGPDGFGIHGGDETTDAVKVYARTTGGKIDRVQALAASCPVETRTPVQPLDDVSAQESTQWLARQVKQASKDAVSGRPIGEGALAALALHRGDGARDALSGFAHDPDTETRKGSVFWSAVLRGAEGAGITSSVMFGDADPEVREHAAFALTQSKSPRVTQDLIRLGNSDASGNVRAKAWFWLAQTGANESEAAIGAAVRKDRDDEVREQAIFALSRLPGERGTKALIAVAEDQSLAPEQRKRAVFWLAQSQTDSAQAYLEKVLARR